MQNLYAPFILAELNISSPQDTAVLCTLPALQLDITWRPNVNSRLEVSQLERNWAAGNTLSGLEKIYRDGYRVII